MTKDEKYLINLLFNFILYELLYKILGFEQTIILMIVDVIVLLIGLKGEIQWPTKIDF